MTALAIVGVGVCATGMLTWRDAQAQLITDTPSAPDPMPRLAPACLPPTERRRANATTRLAVSAAMQAIEGVAMQDVARLASVFTSSDGDGEVLANMLGALAQSPVALSPTLFHNSVFNAPSGYWSIGSGAVAPSITLSAGSGSFAAGLAEAHAQIAVTGNPVLLIAYDAPFPPALSAFALDREPFACALRLASVDALASESFGVVEILRSVPAAPMPAKAVPADLLHRFAGNAAADALPMLLAIALRKHSQIALPWLDGAPLWLEIRP